MEFEVSKITTTKVKVKGKAAKMRYASSGEDSDGREVVIKESDECSFAEGDVIKFTKIMSQKKLPTKKLGDDE